MQKTMSPAGAEASARSAARQFAALGRRVDINPADERARAEARIAELNRPATAGDLAAIESQIAAVLGHLQALQEDIASLKRHLGNPGAADQIRRAA